MIILVGRAGVFNHTTSYYENWWISVNYLGCQVGQHGKLRQGGLDFLGEFTCLTTKSCAFTFPSPTRISSFVATSIL